MKVPRRSGGRCGGLALVLVVAAAAGLAGCDDGGAASTMVDDAATVDAGGRLTDAAVPDADVCASAAETCDGADNDCDGQIDEDFADRGAACALGEGPCATAGQWVCDDAASGLVCDAPPPREPVAEACNGLDDDCDGAADEGIDFARDVDHCGRCNAACVFAHAEPACDQGVCVVVSCMAGFGDANGVAADGCECTLAGEETCNGADDDCDGRVDEGFALGAPCLVGSGACVARGALVCGDDGGLACDAPPIEPQPELCNGLDDDCDGSVDETFDADLDGYAFCAGVTCAADEVCPAGLDCAAICARQDCDDDDRERSPAAREVCDDGVDQNCDGHDAPCSQLASRVNTLVIVTAENTAATCVDFDGDGVPDNAFAKLAPIANPLLSDALAQGSLELLPTLAGALPDLANGRVDLSILLGRRVAAQQYTIRAESYGADGEPLMSFPNALMVEGDITAGPGDFVLGLPVPGGMPGDLRLSEARVTATVVLNGVSVRHDDGRVVGIVTEADLATALETVPANLLPLIQNLLEPDLDRDNDGVPEAYSACVTYTSRPTTVVADPP